jgi:redox-sensitive bicupin YhaK (pirin superfamily)
MRYSQIPPRYQDTPPEKMPIYESEDKKVWIRIVAGESMGIKAAIDTHTPMMFLDIRSVVLCCCLLHHTHTHTRASTRVQPGATHVEKVPKEFDGFLYVYRGAGLVGKDKSKLNMGQVALLDVGEELAITADAEEVRCLVIAGTPIKEPIARHGPFVMNTREEIMQAFVDYQNGKLGEIEGAEERYAKTQAAVATQKQAGSWDKHKEL